MLPSVPTVFPSDEAFSAFVRNLLSPYLSELSDDVLQKFCVGCAERYEDSLREAVKDLLERLKGEGFIDEMQKARFFCEFFEEKKDEEAVCKEQEGGDFVTKSFERPFLQAFGRLKSREAIALIAYYREGLAPRALTVLLGMTTEPKAMRFVRRAMSRFEGLVLHYAGDFRDEPKEKAIALFDELRRGSLPPQRRLFVQEVLADNAGFRQDYQGHLRVIHLLRG